MTDATYWRTRCEAAERALKRARAGTPLTVKRKAVLQALADLKPEEALDTAQLAQVLAMQLPHAHKLLCAMEEIGLIDREHGVRGHGGRLSRWKLAYLVQVEAVE